MAGIVTFLLTVVYAQSALLRLREYYNNKGKLLPEQVIIEPAPIWCIFMGLSSNFWCSIRKKGCVTLSQDCLTSLAGEYLKLQKVVLRFLLWRNLFYRPWNQKIGFERFQPWQPHPCCLVSGWFHCLWFYQWRKHWLAWKVLTKDAGKLTVKDLRTNDAVFLIAGVSLISSIWDLTMG